MSQSEVKKTLNRMNNLTLQEKRGFREIIDALYTDLSDPAVFTGGDYYVATETSTTAYNIDSTLGYETGLPYGFGTLGTALGFTTEQGLTSRTVLSAADSVAAPGVDTTFTTSGDHALSVGDVITLSGFGGDEEYNGAYAVNLVPTSTTFNVTTPYTASLSGTLVKPDTLICGTTGVYVVQWDLQLESALGATGTGFLKWIINTTLSNAGGLRIATDIVAINETHPISGSFVWDATAGDTLFLSIASVNWGSAIKLPQFATAVTRIA